MEYERDLPLRLQFPVEREALPEPGRCQVQVAAIEGQEREAGELTRDAVGILEPAPLHQRLREEVLCPRQVALLGSEIPQRREPIGNSSLVADLPGQRQGLLE